MTGQRLFMTAVVFAAIYFLPVSLSAQGGGCPWCTTPTNCGQVEEDSNLDSCTVTQADGCKANLGACFYDGEGGGDDELPTLPPGGGSDLDVLLAAAGVEAQRVMTDRWGTQSLIEVEPDLFALMSCEGQLLGLVKHADGEMIEYLDPEQYQSAYSIGGLLARRAYIAQSSGIRRLHGVID